MKREDVKKQIPGITDEQLNWLMQENGADINREKSAAEQYKIQLANANAQLKTAQDGLAAFDGKKKPEEYEADIAKLKADMKAQAEGFAFDEALNTAIMGAKGRSVKAVRALLDLDALKGQKKLRSYMLHYLSMMMAVSDIFLLLDGSKEAKEKETELWAYLKANTQPDVYRSIRYGFGGITNLKIPKGDSIVLGCYRIAQKIFKFN